MPEPWKALKELVSVVGGSSVNVMEGTFVEGSDTLILRTHKPYEEVGTWEGDQASLSAIGADIGTAGGGYTVEGTEVTILLPSGLSLKLLGIDGSSTSGTWKKV